MQGVAVIASRDPRDYAGRLQALLNDPVVSYPQVSYSISHTPNNQIYHSATVVYTVVKAPAPSGPTAATHDEYGWRKNEDHLYG